MSLRELVEPDCQGANSLMRLGNQIRHDNAFKDEGFGPSSSFVNRPQQFGSDQLVQEFLGQIAPPQSFRMDALLQEMREIDAQSFHGQMVQRAPLVIDEVNGGFDWANEFSSGHHNHLPPNVDDFLAIESKQLDEFWNQNVLQNVHPGIMQSLSDKPWQNEFEALQQMVSAHCCIVIKVNIQILIFNFFLKNIAGTVPQLLDPSEDSYQFKYSEFMRFMQNADGSQIGIENSQDMGATAADWANDFNSLKTTQGMIFVYFSKTKKMTKHFFF